MCFTKYGHLDHSRGIGLSGHCRHNLGSEFTDTIKYKYSDTFKQHFGNSFSVFENYKNNMPYYMEDTAKSKSSQLRLVRHAQS